MACNKSRCMNVLQIRQITRYLCILNWQVNDGNFQKGLLIWRFSYAIEYFLGLLKKLKKNKTSLLLKFSISISMLFLKHFKLKLFYCMQKTITPTEFREGGILLVSVIFIHWLVSTLPVQKKIVRLTKLKLLWSIPLRFTKVFMSFN